MLEIPSNGSSMMMKDWGNSTEACIQTQNAKRNSTHKQKRDPRKEKLYSLEFLVMLLIEDGHLDKSQLLKPLY